MSESVSRIHVLGLAESASAMLADETSCEVVAGLPEAPSPGDVVVLGVGAGVAGMPHGNAFSACRALKRTRGVKVFLAVASDDPFGAEIARFCMADDVLTVDGEGRLHDVERLVSRLTPYRPRTSVDALLSRLEREVVSDAGRQRSALQKILEQSGEAGFLERLTDPETGLFDGPYAAFKLDEEMKRSSRFHQPLSLVLIDCGVERWPEADGDRRTVLAEIASTFLNHCRDIDVLARFTTTEFLFLLPGTGPDGAETLARRMLDELARREFVVPVEMAPAAGIVTIPQPDLKDRRDLLARAEACLRLAQQGEGRDGICTAGDAFAVGANQE